MQTIGLLGGMSWESSAVYYKLINEGVRARLGGLHSAKVVLWSAEFQDVAAKQAAGDWQALLGIMIEGASALERSGADMLLICTNTMHKLADQVAAAISIPIVHIADIAAAAIKLTPSRRPLLLATRFTMEEPFYRGRMLERHGLDLVRPEPEEERAVHDIIYRELCQGVVEPGSKARCLDIIAAARRRGADGVILGCTELDLLLSQADSDLPVFDTTALHAAAAVELAVAGHPAAALTRTA
ncbi:aspartate/glutamate racemase family protein [Bosea sp. BIWAKO-01]|uniref:aspartate/glutamate racemase family protein n=1 Tax=Bosea sp. BIWAKO-01 TaxID=506668 RepID=UPI000853CD66|nr:aspartate/glutamate racemase family protein [Bosea sp. BIWAKO-01]GAU84765.1 aspartate racemase [Bosea sp. BIWAKO-01]